MDYGDVGADPARLFFLSHGFVPARPSPADCVRVGPGGHCLRRRDDPAARALLAAGRLGGEVAVRARLEEPHWLSWPTMLRPTCSVIGTYQPHDRYRSA